MPWSVFPTAAKNQMITCPQLFRVPTFLRVKAQVLPSAHKDLHDLPHPLPVLLSSLSLPRSLCSSHMGLLMLPQAHQAWSCLRA